MLAIIYAVLLLNTFFVETERVVKVLDQYFTHKIAEMIRFQQQGMKNETKSNRSLPYI